MFTQTQDEISLEQAFIKALAQTKKEFEDTVRKLATSEYGVRNHILYLNECKDAMVTLSAFIADPEKDK